MGSNSLALQALKGDETIEASTAWETVLEAADAVLKAVDQEAVIRFVALKTPEEGPGASKRTRQMEEQKEAVITALHAKSKTLLDVFDRLARPI